jgi:hypothetical protein
VLLLVILKIEKNNHVIFKRRIAWVALWPPLVSSASLERTTTTCTPLSQARCGSSA